MNCRDLDVVDGDLGLVLTCDDQVLLLGPLELQTPPGHPMDARASEISARKVCIDQSGGREVCPPSDSPC